MLESQFFKSIKDKLSELPSLFEGNGFISRIFQVAYFLLVLPFFMLMTLCLFLYSLPGMIVHSILWSAADMRTASEPTKVLHDVSLITCCAVSVYFLFGIFTPLIGSDLYDEYRCITQPYC